MDVPWEESTKKGDYKRKRQRKRLDAENGRERCEGQVEDPCSSSQRSDTLVMGTPWGEALVPEPGARLMFEHPARSRSRTEKGKQCNLLNQASPADGCPSERVT